MFGILSQESKYHLNDINGNSGGTFAGSGIGNSSAIRNTLPLSFDFNISQIKAAASKGKGSESDIRSAYELFSTGQTQGRALGYAQDIQRRFTPGLLSTYGSADIRTAAANYLDSVGLPRLAQVVLPETTRTTTTTPVKDTDKQFFPLPVPPDKITSEKNPFELLIDAFTRSFGNAVYNPPLQSQSSGFTGQSTDVPLSEVASGSNIGTFVIIGVVGVIAYFLYKRFAG